MMISQGVHQLSDRDIAAAVPNVPIAGQRFRTGFMSLWKKRK